MAKLNKKTAAIGAGALVILGIIGSGGNNRNNPANTAESTEKELTSQIVIQNSRETIGPAESGSALAVVVDSTTFTAEADKTQTVKTTEATHIDNTAEVASRQAAEESSKQAAAEAASRQAAEEASKKAAAEAASRQAAEESSRQAAAEAASRQAAEESSRRAAEEASRQQTVARNYTVTNTNKRVVTLTPGMTVYVSKNNKAHRVSNCSGMKNYTEMTIEEAMDLGVDYCGNCIE